MTPLAMAADQTRLKYLGLPTPGKSPSPLKSRKRRLLATPRQHTPPHAIRRAPQKYAIFHAASQLSCKTLSTLTNNAFATLSLRFRYAVALVYAPPLPAFRGPCSAITQ